MLGAEFCALQVTLKRGGSLLPVFLALVEAQASLQLRFSGDSFYLELEDIELCISMRVSLPRVAVLGVRSALHSVSGCGFKAKGLRCTLGLSM